jgi:hypothetical protein
LSALLFSRCEHTTPTTAPKRNAGFDRFALATSLAPEIGSSAGKASSSSSSSVPKRLDGTIQGAAGAAEAAAETADVSVVERLDREAAERGKAARADAIAAARGMWESLEEKVQWTANSNISTEKMC